MFKKGLKVLVVDPEFNYWKELEAKEEWLVEFDICFTKNQASKKLKEKVYSLIIVNIEFYKEELLEMRYQGARQKFEGPIVFLSDDALIEKRLDWLEMGVFDVWPKSIDYNEMQYKIIRICELETNHYTYGIDMYTINESKQQIWCGDKKLKLSPIPYKLLLYLLKNPDKDLSRELLLKQVWNYDVSAGDRVVDKNINTIRKCTNDIRIKSVYGYGYKFEMKNNSEKGNGE